MRARIGKIDEEQSFQKHLPDASCRISTSSPVLSEAECRPLNVDEHSLEVPPKLWPVVMISAITGLVVDGGCIERNDYLPHAASCFIEVPPRRNGRPTPNGEVTGFALTGKCCIML